MRQFNSAWKLSYIIFSIITLLATGNALAEEERRTPLQKYQGAYAGAFLICFLQQKQVFLLEKAKLKGVTLDPEFGKDIDLEACKNNGLGKMKVEYLNVLPMVKNKEGRDALKEHYVHAIMHIKEITPWTNESEETHTERMERTYRESKELYVRFEITQP